MKTQNKKWCCPHCNWTGPKFELNKLGVHECCPECMSMDVDILKKPNPEDYGLNDVDYFQDCKDYEMAKMEEDK